MRTNIVTELVLRALVEAAAWRSRLAGSEVESSAVFEKWLVADPQNRAAWTQVQGAWDLYGEHAASPELINLRRAALAHAHKAARERWTRPQRPFPWFRVAIGASIVGLVLLLGWQLLPSPDIYQTRIGERRVETLLDGSQITLDSQSEVRVQYSAHARDLILVRGQARFDVAHDSDRPFSVTAGGHKVVATGTSFNVDLYDSNLLVTLIEGHVLVWPGGALPSAPVSVALDAGEQLTIMPDAPSRVSHVNSERATAWQSGELIFQDEPLGSVVARINRYSRHPVRIGDAATAALRISGVFHTGDERAFVTTIVSYLPLRAEADEGGAIRLVGAD